MPEDPEHDEDDVEKNVTEYRDVMGRMEELQAAAQRLPDKWKAYNGGDNSELHELAFGEHVEE